MRGDNNLLYINCKCIVRDLIENFHYVQATKAVRRGTVSVYLRVRYNNRHVTCLI